MITPPFVIGLALILLFGRSGAVNALLEWGFAIKPTRWIYGMPGVWLAQTLALTPVAYLVLLSVAEHKSRLEVGGGLGEAIPDGMAGLLLDDMRPALRQGQYGSAMVSAAETIGSTIAKAKGVTLTAQLPRQRAYPQQDNGIPWPMILAGVVVLLL